MNTTEYKIQTDTFEGPIGTLLTMIENKKLDISDVSLSEIAEDYLKRVKEMQEFPTEEAAEFVFITSILILIKSKVLLPMVSFNEDELDINILKQKLILLKYIRDKSEKIFNNFEIKSHIASPIKQEKEVLFSPDEECTIEGMRKNIATVKEGLMFWNRKADIEVESVIKLGDMIKNLEESINQIGKISFSQFTSKTSKKDYIVSFLALLELIKNGICEVKQNKMFSDISIEKA